MKGWQFDLTFVVALGLLVFFTIAPYLGLEATPNPVVVSAFSALIGFLFTRRDRITHSDKNEPPDG